MSYFLCPDLGYGDNKIVTGNTVTGIEKMYKFPSVIAEVTVNELVSDDRVVTFEGKSYYVGEDALSLQSNSIIDISNYNLLEYAAPLFIGKIIKDLDQIPDKIIMGLSIAQIGNSGHFKTRIFKYLKDSGIDIEIDLVPQGMVSKLAIDKYGVGFPNLVEDFAQFQNYVGCDIGFNTLDIFRVINGKTSTSLVKGIENQGIQIIVSGLIEDIEEKTGFSLTMSEAKKVLDEKILNRRGKTTNFIYEIGNRKRAYVEELKIIIENEFGEVLDKSSSLVLLGGGAYCLASEKSDFIKIPTDKAEYYNAISYFFSGCKNDS